MRLWERLLLGFCVWIVAFVSVVLFSHLVPQVAPPWPGSDGSNFVTALADVIRAMQWPLVALILATVFRKDISSLLGKVKSGKIFGHEFELREELDDLQRSATASRVEVDASQTRAEAQEASPAPNIDQSHLPGIEPDQVWVGEPSQSDSSRPDSMSAQHEIFRVAAESPKAAILLLSTYLEEALRSIAKSVDLDALAHPAPGGRGPVGIATRMSDVGMWPRELADSVQKFWRVRNAVVHEGKGNDEDVIRAIDSGLSILQSLKGFPPTRYPPF